MNLAKWLYRNRRPNWVASVLNRYSAAVYALGIAPHHLVTLEVRGRRSRQTIRLPLVRIAFEGERYLVSMLRSRWPRSSQCSASFQRAWPRERRTEPYRTWTGRMPANFLAHAEINRRAKSRRTSYARLDVRSNWRHLGLIGGE